MAELATIARPYAEALFQVTRPDDLSTVRAQLDALALMASDATLRLFAANPKTSAKEVIEVMAAAAKQPLDGAMGNFLLAIVENGRLTVLPAVAEQFHQLASAAQGVSEAMVESAFPMDDTQLAELGIVLEKRFGRKLSPSVKVEPSLIGGVRVTVGDEVLDTSVRARLERMKTTLTA